MELLVEQRDLNAESKGYGSFFFLIEHSSAALWELT